MLQVISVTILASGSAHELGSRGDTEVDFPHKCIETQMVDVKAMQTVSLWMNLPINPYMLTMLD